MARSFVRTSSHEITLGLGALGFAGPFTCATIIKRAEDGIAMGWYRAGTGAAASIGCWVKETSNKLLYWNQSAELLATSLTFTVADGWCLIACSKASGTTTPRFHKYVYSSNAWTHENGTGNIADPSTPGSNAYLGGIHGSNYWNGDIELVGTWNVALTDAQIESLPFSLTAWYQEAPKGLWPLYQQATGQPVLDVSGGGANQSSIVGTTVSTSSVPVFSYGGPTRRVLKQPAAGVGGAAGPRDLLLLKAG